jgi:hypothetical protein
MGLDTAWRPAAGAGSANGNGAHSGARQSAGTPLGNSPLSGHQVELVQTERTAASLCPRE